jgi:uncharacterized membrane protein YuzA (DUF378 family)
MAELVTLIGTLAMTLVGVAVLLQITSVEEALGFMGRAMTTFVLMLVGLCILKSFWLGGCSRTYQPPSSLSKL